MDQGEIPGSVHGLVFIQAPNSYSILRNELFVLCSDDLSNVHKGQETMHTFAFVQSAFGKGDDAFVFVRGS